MRRRWWTRGRVAAVVGAAAFVLATTAAVAMAFAVERWGCKSQAELDRSRSPDDVAAAFAEAGFSARAGTAPGAIVADDPRYRGASAYRCDSERAAFWVIVCRARCADAPEALDRPRVVEGRQLRLFAALGNNIGFFTTDNDRRSGRQLQEPRPACPR